MKKINGKIEIALIFLMVYLLVFNVNKWIKHETLERYHTFIEDENFLGAVKKNNLIAIQKIAHKNHAEFQKRNDGEIVQTSSSELPPYSLIKIEQKTSPQVLLDSELKLLQDTLPYRKYYNGKIYVIFPLETETEDISYVFFAPLIP